MDPRSHRLGSSVRYDDRSIENLSPNFCQIDPALLNDVTGCYVVHMTTMQLTVLRDHDGKRVAKLNPLHNNAASLTATTVEGFKPVFGTFDLMTIATRADAQGYRLSSILATDSQLHLLRNEQQSAAKKRLLDSWRTAGAEGIFDALDGPLRGRAIASIELLDQSNRTVRLGRNGDIEAADETIAKAFADIAVLAVD